MDIDKLIVHLKRKIEEATKLSMDAKKCGDDKRDQFWWGQAVGLGEALKYIKNNKGS